MITFKTTGGVLLSEIPLTENIEQQVVLTNTGFQTVTVKIFVAGRDGAAASDCTDSNGKEISLESWVSIKHESESTWTGIGEPSEFPESFDDLSDNCYITQIGSGLSRTYDLKIEIPEGFSTSGIAVFSLVVMSVPL